MDCRRTWRWRRRTAQKMNPCTTPMPTAMTAINRQKTGPDGPEAYPTPKMMPRPAALRQSSMCLTKEDGSRSNMTRARKLSKAMSRCATLSRRFSAIVAARQGRGPNGEAEAAPSPRQTSPVGGERVVIPRGRGAARREGDTCRPDDHLAKRDGQGGINTLGRRRQTGGAPAGCVGPGRGPHRSGRGSNQTHCGGRIRSRGSAEPRG